MDGMEYLSPFDGFDPMDGMPTHHYFDQANLIAHRARRLLKERSREDILYIVETINFMFLYRDPVSQQFAQLADLDDVEDEWAFSLDGAIGVSEESLSTVLGQQPGLPGETVRSHPNHWYASPCVVLNGCMEIFEISGQEQLPNVQWSEYFAALALALLGESRQIPSQLPVAENDDVITRDLRESHLIAPWVMDALEAVSKAEFLGALAEQESEADKVSKKVHLSRQQGGINRHKKTNETKLDFIRFVTDSVIPSLAEGEVLNRSAAVREFFQEFLVDDAPKDFEEALRYRENWFRTLTNAYRAYEKKGELPRTS